MIRAKTGMASTIVVIALIAIAAIMMPMISTSPVTLHSPANSYDMLHDRDVEFILRSSLFEGVNTSTSHSASKHPNDQELKDKCLNGDGMPVMAMFHPNTKHCVEIIQTSAEEGGRIIERWLVRVVKQVDGVYNELTAFTDEWANIQEVENYLNAGGYMHLWP